MRIAGITLGFLIIITAILTFAIYNLDTLINKNKGYILSQIENNTGRNAEVDKISLNIFGGLGIQLTNFELDDDPDFSSEHFVKAPNLVVNVKFLPLLKKELAVKRIILNNPSINIIKDKNGIYNFETIKEASGSKENKADKKDGLAGFSIAFINISDGKVFFKDKQNKTDLTLTDIDMVSENIGSDKPVNINLALALLSDKQNINLALTGGPVGDEMNFKNIPVKGKINIDSLNTTALQQNLPLIKETLPAGLGLSGPLSADLEFNGISSDLDIESMEIRAGILNSENQNFMASGTIGPLGNTSALEKTSISVDFQLGPLPIEQLGKLEPVARSFPDELRGSGPLNASGSISGKIDSPELKSLKIEATGAQLAYGDIFSKPGDMKFHLITDAFISGNNITINSSELALGSLVINSKGTVRSGENTYVDLSLSSGRADLKELNEVLPPIREYELAGDVKVDANVNGEYGESSFPEIRGYAKLHNMKIRLPQLEKPVQEINGEIKFTGKKATVEKTSAIMGESRVSLFAEVNSYSPLSVNYKMTSPAVYLSDITPEQQGELKDLDIKGNITSTNNATSIIADITSGGGEISRIDYTKMQGKITMKNEKLNIEDLDFKLLSGYMKTKGFYDMSGEVPVFNINSSLQGVSITNIIKTFLSTKSDHIRGTGNLSLNLSGRGNSWEQISESLDGLGNIELTEGEFVDFNLAEEILTGLTGIQGLSGLISTGIENKYPDIFKTTNTVFYNLNTPLKIVNGKINFNDLLIKASDYLVEGNGWIGLNKRIEADGYLTLTDKISSDLTSRMELIKYLNDENGRVRIPFIMDGSLPGIKPVPNLSYVADTFRKAAVDKGKEQLKKKILDELSTGGKKADTESGEQTEPGEEIKKKLRELIPIPSGRQDGSERQQSGTE